VLFVTTRGPAEAALPALAAAARPGQKASVAGERLLALGPEAAVAPLLAGGSGIFRDARARMKSPRFWLSATPDKFARVGLLARLSAAEHAPLRALFARLERADFVVYETGGDLHLTANATLEGPADPALAAALSKLEAGFRAFAPHQPPTRARRPGAPQGALHGKGAIVDLAPFPAALPELYLHLFHPDLDLDLAELLSLAALAELVLDFDRAIFDPAIADGERSPGARRARGRAPASRGDDQAPPRRRPARTAETGVAFGGAARKRGAPPGPVARQLFAAPGRAAGGRRRTLVRMDPA
jgi:hypothetical protein